MVNTAISASAMRIRMMTEVRFAARRIGLVPYLRRIRGLVQRVRGESTYEARFDRALMSQVRAGDVAWDIGANVGLYTTRLAEAVGPSGKVVAFEPVPSCYAELVRRTQELPQVLAMGVALSNQAGTALMSLESDPLSTTNSLAAPVGANATEIPIGVAFELVQAGKVPSPNILKIDVEGFEEEVLLGLGPLLREPSCRALLIEMHFGILDRRGQRQAPARISDLLRSSGFTLRWVDASHLEAVRE
jgi:FkbM family methyltransferase